MVKTADGFEGFVLSASQIFVSELIQRYGELLMSVARFATPYAVFAVPLYNVFFEAPMWYVLGIFCPLQLAPWIMFLLNKRTFSLLRMLLPCCSVTSLALVIQSIFADRSRMALLLRAVCFLCNAILVAFVEVHPFETDSPLALEEMWPVKQFNDAFKIKQWTEIGRLEDFMNCSFEVLLAHEFYIWIAGAFVLVLKATFGRSNKHEKTELERALGKDKTD